MWHNYGHWDQKQPILTFCFTFDICPQPPCTLSKSKKTMLFAGYENCRDYNLIYILSGFTKKMCCVTESKFIQHGLIALLNTQPLYFQLMQEMFMWTWTAGFLLPWRYQLDTFHHNVCGLISHTRIKIT